MLGSRFSRTLLAAAVTCSKLPSLNGFCLAPLGQAIRQQRGSTQAQHSPIGRRQVLGMTTTTNDKKDDNPSTTIEDDNAIFQKAYKFGGHSTGSSSVAVTFSDTCHTLETDVPVPMGGKDTAPQPVEHLLAAWAGCTQATARFVGRHMTPNRVLLSRLDFVDCVALRDERGAIQLPLMSSDPGSIPSRVHTLQGRIVVHARHPLTAEQLTTLKEQTELRCPIANMLAASGCDVQVEWELYEDQEKNRK